MQEEAAKPQLLDFLAGEPEAENDPFADQPTKTAPELPELTPAQELAGYIRSRSAAALVTPHALLVSEVENADELLAQCRRKGYLLLLQRQHERQLRHDRPAH